MNRRFHALVAALGSSALLCAGCFSFGGKPSPPIKRYRVDYAAAAPVDVSLPVTLRLMQLRAAATYDRPDIVYRQGAHRFGTYNYRRWAVDPARMIGDQIGRDLVQAGLFRAVLQGPSPLTADYILDGRVEQIEELVDEGCTAHLRLRFTLTHRITSAESQPLFQKIYDDQQRCRGNEPEDLVEAMSAALASISAQLRADLIESIRSTRE